MSMIVLNVHFQRWEDFGECTAQLFLHALLLHTPVLK